MFLKDEVLKVKDSLDVLVAGQADFPFVELKTEFLKKNSIRTKLLPRNL